MYELFRDDDISVTSNITLLTTVHDEFLKANKIHTVAVLMNNLWENKEVWYWLMTAKNLVIGLHGWDHIDYGQCPYDAIAHDIDRSLEYWTTRATRGQYKPPRIDTFFPPWNSIGDNLVRACEAKNLKLDNRIGPPVYNFHYWTCNVQTQLDRLRHALID